MIFRYEVPQASVKARRTSSDTEQKQGFEPDTSAPVRTCLRVGVRVPTVTPFTDWLEKPMGGFCDRLQTQPRRMDVPNYTTAPTGTELQVHVWACACAELSLHCPQPCRYHISSLSLALPVSHSSLLFVSHRSVLLPRLEHLCLSVTHRKNSATPLSCFAGAIIWMTHSFPIT